MRGTNDSRWALVALLLPLGCGCAPVTDSDYAAVGESAPPHCKGAPTFAPSVRYGAASGPDGFVVADLNGDGRPDLVVPTRTHILVSPGYVDEILVLLNLGDGTFGKGASYKLRHDPTVGVGDLDGDGKPEIVVSWSEASTVTVLHNDGTGTFAAQPPISVAPAAGAVVVGDVNGDRKLDVTWFGGGALHALINQGGGSFTDAPVASSAFTGDLMVTGALNGDGMLDVVSSSNAGVYVYLGKGNGTFLPPTIYHPRAKVTALSLVSWRGAGATDILASGTTDSVLLNSGTGTFSTQVAIASPPPITAVADMNGDGKADLLSVQPGAVSDAVDVWLNGGQDAFSTLVSVPVARYCVTAQASDLNGDGLPDIVALSQPGANVGALSVALNICPH